MDEQDKNVPAGTLHAGDVLRLRAQGSWEEWQLIGCGPPVISLTPEYFSCP